MPQDKSALPLVSSRGRADPNGRWPHRAQVCMWIALFGCAIGALAFATRTDSTYPAALRGDADRRQSKVDAVSLLACSSAKQAVQDPAGFGQKRATKDSKWFLDRPDPEVVLTTIPRARSIHELPEHWDWRDFNGTGISLVTSIQNQMVPKPCGSCWAFATTSALSDRIRIAQFRKYGKLGPEVLLSPQVLLDCGMLSFGSCEGGDPRFAHKWIYENGIVDTTCNPYIAAHPSWFGVTTSCAASQCRRCTLQGECHVLEKPKKYYIAEYGTMNATTLEEFELEAMNEIYHRGPIVVSMFSHAPAYVNYQGGFVLRDPTNYGRTTHVVSLIGWGTDEHGVKYWIVRNSDGTNWGEDGFFRAERGVNIYNMEGHGAWAVPIV